MFHIIIIGTFHISFHKKLLKIFLYSALALSLQSVRNAYNLKSQTDVKEKRDKGRAK